MNIFRLRQNKGQNGPGIERQPINYNYPTSRTRSEAQKAENAQAEERNVARINLFDNKTQARANRQNSQPQ